jgi:hypothetical protein
MNTNELKDSIREPGFGGSRGEGGGGGGKGAPPETVGEDIVVPGKPDSPDFAFPSTPVFIGSVGTLDVLAETQDIVVKATETVPDPVTGEPRIDVIGGTGRRIFRDLERLRQDNLTCISRSSDNLNLNAARDVAERGQDIGEWLGEKRAGYPGKALGALVGYGLGFAIATGGQEAMNYVRCISSR